MSFCEVDIMRWKGLNNYSNIERSLTSDFIGAQEDVKQFLTMQQRGMAHLLDTARQDLAALNTIAEGMSRLVRA